MTVDVRHLGQSEALTKSPNEPQSSRQSVHLPGFPALGPCTWGSEDVHTEVMCWDCPSCWLDVVKMSANGACERQLCPGAYGRRCARLGPPCGPATVSPSLSQEGTCGASWLARSGCPLWPRALLGDTLQSSPSAWLGIGLSGPQSPGL